MKKVKLLSLVISLCFVAFSSFKSAPNGNLSTMYGLMYTEYIGGGLTRYHLRDLNYTSDYGCFEGESVACLLVISPFENVVDDGFGDLHIDVNPFNPPTMSVYSDGIFYYEE